MASKLEWTIFRLTAIMGVKNHKMTGLMFHMPLSTPMEICMPEDTARAFTNGIEKRDQLKNKVFNLAGGPSCRTSYEEFLGINFRMKMDSEKLISHLKHLQKRISFVEIISMVMT